MTKSTKFPRAGYRIHFDRLRDIRANVSAIRTHKFKCEIPKEAEAELKQKFADVSAVVDSSERGSLLWFLVQLYGLGFLFVSKENKKTSLLKNLYGEEGDEIEVSSEYANHIKNQGALREFLTKNPRSVFENIVNDHLPQSIIKSLGEIFGADKKISVENLLDYSEIKRAHDGLLEITKNKKRLNQDDIQEFFGVKIESENTGGTTFVIQEIPFDELQKNSSGEVDIYTAYFRYLSTAAQKTKFDIQSLAGVSENQNALSNLLNKSLKEFQKGFEETKRLIGFANPEYFEKNPETLAFIAKTVHGFASEIKSSSQADFIADNWGDYRNLMGGRLQGWLSNFQNRLGLFEKFLSDEIKDEKDKKTHKDVFEEIKKNCDWERIFPASQKLNFEKLCELRSDLAHALLVIKGEAESKEGEKDFGTLLDEYNQYLQAFREFLMRWNNEGISKNFEDEKGQEHEVILRKISKKDNATPGELEIFETLLENQKKKKQKKNSTEDDEEKSENLDKKIIGYWSRNFVPAELDRYPRFIGAAQKDPLEEIKKARESLFLMTSEALQLVRKIREINSKDQNFSSQKWLSGRNEKGHGFFHKNLDGLKNLAERYGEKSLEKSSSFKFLPQFIDLEKTKSEEQKQKWSEKKLSSVKFFVSGYEYRNKQFLAVKEVGFDDYLKKFEEHFGLQNISSAKDVENWLGFQNNNISYFTNEHGEILKIYLSLLLRDLSKKIKLPDSTQTFSALENTTLASLIFEKSGQLKSQEIDSATVRRFFASSIGSEIRSKISILSRKDFVKRNVIQITNGAQSLLRYVPIEWGNFDHLDQKTQKKIHRRKKAPKKSFSSQALEILSSAGIEETKTNEEIAKEIWKNFAKQTPEAQKKLAQVLGEMPHRWEMVLKTKQELKSLKSLSEGFLIEKSNEKNIFDFCTKKSDFLYSFPIQTSVYQKQFLDKFLGGDQKEILTEKILGASVIIEETVDVKSRNERDFSFYCAIPFQFSKEETRPEKSDPNSGKYRLSTKDHENILGIDLGEYGFGWAVFNPKTEKFLASSFMEIPLLSKMRAEAANWKDTQASGIFSRPTTHLADLREQAAGQIRNQIHQLAITHNARPVYEDSVDGFESGGQRVSKLYKTLKTADVSSGGSNKADDSVRKHFWGTEYAQIGGVIGAAKTSQTCRCCGRCATAEISALEGNKVKIENNKIVGTDVFCKKEDGEFDKKEIENLVKKAQRFESEEEKIVRESGKKKRGSVDQFQCQICKNKTDADAQAAQNIALKFYLRKFVATEDNEKNPKFQTGKDSKQFSSLKFFLEKSKDKKYQLNPPN